MRERRQKNLGRKLLTACVGIIATCLITVLIFFAWFYIREVVFRDEDNLIAMSVQMIVCAGLLFVGCGASIVYAFIGDRDKSCDLSSKTMSQLI